MTDRSFSICEPYGGTSDNRTAATVASDLLWVQTLNYAAPYGSPTVLQVKSATLAMDKTWAPYAQATIVCAQPSDAQLEAIDPRGAPHLRVRFTQRQIVDGVTTDRQWNLMLRSRSLNWLTGELTLTATSDEAQLQDYIQAADSNQVNAQATLQTVMENGSLYLINFPGTVYMSPNCPNPLIPAADENWQAGTTGWDYIQGLSEPNSVWQHFDELGNFWSSELTYSPDTSTHYLNDATMIKSVSDDTSRDDPTWANWVVVQYQGQVTTATGGAQTATASGTGSTGSNAARKGLNVSRPGKKPSAGNAATKILNNAQARGRVLTIDAIADITARPNQTWNVAYATQNRTGVVQSVSYTLPDGTMTLRIAV